MTPKSPIELRRKSYLDQLVQQQRDFRIQFNQSRNPQEKASLNAAISSLTLTLDSTLLKSASEDELEKLLSEMDSKNKDLLASSIQKYGTPEAAVVTALNNEVANHTDVQLKLATHGALKDFQVYDALYDLQYLRLGTPIST